jgi:uncharacterized damage-inducible protein DinB
MKSTHTSPELLDSVREILRQGEILLPAISDEAYTCKLAVAFNSSIGGHYRHCLDHFQILLNAVGAGDLDYDQRERGTRVETDRLAALEATRELIVGYQDLDPAWLSRSLAVTCKTNYATSGSQTSPSTIGREVMYSVAHAVHHYALIGVMAGILGVPLPAGFGIAPSTLKHQATALATSTPLAPAG